MDAFKSSDEARKSLKVIKAKLASGLDGARAALATVHEGRHMLAWWLALDGEAYLDLPAGQTATQWLAAELKLSPKWIDQLRLIGGRWLMLEEHNQKTRAKGTGGAPPGGARALPPTPSLAGKPGAKPPCSLRATMPLMKIRDPAKVVAIYQEAKAQAEYKAEQRSARLGRPVEEAVVTAKGIAARVEVEVGREPKWPTIEGVAKRLLQLVQAEGDSEIETVVERVVSMIAKRSRP